VADELHVLGVAVDEDLRRRGLGGALMREAHGYAGRHGIRLLLLEVRRSNRAAIRLYRRLGWSAMGLRPGYYSDGEDALEMSLTLDPATGDVVPSKDEIHVDA
jgi:ribosomal-protein-alanine N-acetyltransferase